MTTFTKRILPVGRYSIPRNGQRVDRKFSTKDLRQLAETANKMVASGLTIPAPFEHSPEAIPSPITDKPAHSFLNAGHWTKFWISNKDGKPALYGEIDAPGDPSDWNTPAGKISTTAKETSISFQDSWEDGLHRQWKNAIMHVAVVSKPVVPSQEDFTPSTSFVNMSMASDSSSQAGVSDGDIPLLRTKLKDYARIALPEDCTPQTLIRDLLTAVMQLEFRPTEDGTVLQPAPIYMSMENDMPFTQAQIDALVATKAVNPATNQPFTAADFVVAPAPQKDTRLETAEKLIQGLGAAFKKNITDTFSKRIDALVQSGRINKELAETIRPKVPAFNLSVVEGGIAPHPLEDTLAILEALPSTMPATSMSSQMPPVGHVIQPLPSMDGTTPLSEKDSEDLANEMLGYLQ